VISDYTFNKLDIDSCPQPFTCGEGSVGRDLDEFFHEDALDHLKQLLAVTYYYETEDKTVAYFSVINDKIVNKDNEANRIISKVMPSLIPHKKRRISYPAAKVVRLGVHAECQSQGVGSEILDFLKSFFTVNNKTGCRFITVDAYNKTKVVDFYKKNGFKFLTEEDKNEDTRLMYFDLIFFSV
jgi:GNAT superfamily N-acetyltransferase